MNSWTNDTKKNKRKKKEKWNEPRTSNELRTMKNVETLSSILNANIKQNENKLQLFSYSLCYSRNTHQIRNKTWKQTNQLRVDCINTFKCLFGRFCRCQVKFVFMKNGNKFTCSLSIRWVCIRVYVCTSIAMHEKLYRIFWINMPTAKITLFVQEFKVQWKRSVCKLVLSFWNPIVSFSLSISDRFILVFSALFKKN